MRPEDLSKRWVEILKKEGRQKADLFFVENIVPHISKNFKLTNNKYSKIIIPVGRAIDKLALLATCVKSDEYHFLTGTKDSLETIDILTEIIKLKTSQIRIHNIILNDPFSIYKTIREIWEENRKAKIAVYVSSGTTSISATLIMSARYFNFDVLYQEWGKYDMDIKQADPILRTIKKLEDPLEVYGDLELERAKILFDKLKFGDVIKILEDIKRRTMKLEYVLFLESLTKCYIHWQRFEFRAAQIFLNQALELSGQFSKSYKPGLIRNSRILKILSDSSLFKNKLKNPKYVISFVYELMTRAKVTANENDYMFAITYIYRCIDIVVQSELVMRNIDPWKVDWNHIESRAGEKYLKTWKRLTGLKGKMDERIGLMQGITLLSALNEKRQYKIRDIWEASKFRNSLIIEHGDRNGNERLYKKIENLGSEIIEEYKKDYKVKSISLLDAGFLTLEEKNMSKKTKTP